MIDLQKLSPQERFEFEFNWTIKYVMPYYKAEVMAVHGIASEEYYRRTLEADESSYLPQPNPKFSPTHYDRSIAHVLGLDYKGMQEKFDRNELEHKIATEGFGWRDEDPNAIFKIKRIQLSVDRMDRMALTIVH